MAGQPYFPLYVGDWKKDPEVLDLDAEGRALWLEMLLLMHESQSGTLRETPGGYAKKCSLLYEQVCTGIDQIESSGVADVTRHDDGAVTVVCRRIDKDIKERQQNRDRQRRYRKRQYKKKFRQVADEWGEYCQCCGATKNLQLDHVKPKVDGGTNEVGNLQILCGTCNKKKGDDEIDYRGSVTDDNDDLTDSSVTENRREALHNGPNNGRVTSFTESEGENEDDFEDKGKGGVGEKDPDYDAAMESWNEFAGSVDLPQIRKMTKKRRASVRSKWGDVWPYIEEIYDTIRGSPFLLGREGRGTWNGATFDFVWIREDHHTRILEGAYGGKENGGKAESRLDRFNHFIQLTGGAGSS